MRAIIFVAGILAGAIFAGGTDSSGGDGPRKVTGIGGIFFKCKDSAMMRAWYAKYLGLQTDQFGTNFEWRLADDPTKKGFTQWSPFAQDTKYFEPSKKDFMIDYRVENLDWLLGQLKNEGVPIVGKVEVETYVKFAHIVDRKGNCVELWEPNDGVYDKVVVGRTK
jgi:predicted enzyme related to lactoylglutathione lyase